MNARTRTEPSLRDSRLFTKHLADYVLPTILDDEYITFAIFRKAIKDPNRLRFGTTIAREIAE